MSVDPKKVITGQVYATYMIHPKLDFENVYKVVKWTNRNVIQLLGTLLKKPRFPSQSFLQYEHRAD
jgi:hypothetical protein